MPDEGEVSYTCDILRWWDVSSCPNRTRCMTDFLLQLQAERFPHLFHVAMDILPVQASAVSCERFFLSAADTDDPDRNRLHPALMEALQVIKFSVKQDRFNFVPDLVAKEEEYSIDGPVSRRAVSELTATNSFTELEGLFRNANTLDPVSSVTSYSVY
jgi:hypothetical protein